MTLVYRSTVGRRLTVSEGDGNIAHLATHVGNSATIVGNGTTDDTTTIQNAISALTDGGTLYYTGTPLITNKITIDKRINLVSLGAAGSVGLAPTSYFIKDASMTTTAIEITAVGASLVRGGVIAQNGNTGDNITVLGRGVFLDHVYSYNAGNDGFSIGDPAAATDANYCKAIGCTAFQNDRDGFHIESSAPNANAGMYINCIADENGRDGIRNAKAHTNVFLNCNGSGNTGWGFYNDACEYTVLIGGDFESNTADGTNQVYNSANAEFLTVVGLRPEFKLKDDSFTLANQAFNFLTKRLDSFVELEMEWQPVLTGDGTASKTVSTISRTTTTVTFGASAHGYAVGEAVAIEETGTLFDGGYLVSTVPTTSSFTAVVGSDRAGKLPASYSGSGKGYLGYDQTVAGRFSRRGNDVYFQAHIVADNQALDGTVTGDLIVRGFPYPSENTSSQIASVSVLDQGVTYPSSTTALRGYISPNAYFMNLVGVGNELTAQAVPTGASGFPITGALTISGHYRVTPYSV